MPSHTATTRAPWAGSASPGILKAKRSADRRLAMVPATIAILQHRATLEAQVLNQQLQHALNGRVVIEQAVTPHEVVSADRSPSCQ